MNREALRLYLVTNRYQDPWKVFLKRLRRLVAQGLP